MARETLTVLARRSALAGRTAIVTGASGAFGSATMEVLRYLGAHPIGIDRKPGDGVLACDVTDGEQVAPVIGEATWQLGGTAGPAHPLRRRRARSGRRPAAG